MRTFIPVIITVIVAALATLAGTSPAAAQQPAKDVAHLEQLASEANTPARHAEVARLYRFRADELSAKAAKHEAEVRRLRAARQPLEHKIPESMLQPLARERDQAIQARRAAREASALAQQHTQLTVELLALR